MKLRMLAVAAAACLAISATAAERLTYVDLVKRLTSLERLATLPAAGERALQCSSYDRASRYDAATGKYLGWDANGDGQGIIREENGQLVLAEMEGPGCIWRIWSAAPAAGHVRITIDGAAAPTIDLPFTGYFDGKNAPFIFPSLVYDASSGKNCFVPIPFARSCKVTADKGWGNYYHFTYTRYPADVTVPSFTRDLGKPEMDALAAADRALGSGLGNDPAGLRRGEDTIEGSMVIAPGASVIVGEIDGPRAITAIRARVACKDRADEVAAMREMAIRITWDGAAEPAVWAPLGDFFGTAPGINQYRSFPSGIAAEGGYALWYMPFARSARVEIVNDGKVSRTITGSITHAPLTLPVGEFGRFHAKWHRDAFLPAEPDRKIDWTMLKTTGRGRFCGVLLHIWNPAGGWWGEGDEKFYVDGEKFPSTIGTGSEDYFGYAWGNPALFQHAYHDQTYNNRNNRGNIAVNRWHIVDNVPFQTGFEGAIEKYYTAEQAQYACTAFWYEAPGGGDRYAAADVSQRLGYFQLDPPEPPKVAGAKEGEDLEILERSAGVTQNQDMDTPAFSGGKHLWWTGAKPGAHLTLQFRSELDAACDIVVALTKAADYGIVQLSVDGEKIGQPIDLYHDGVVPTGPITLGARTLTRSNHTLTVEIVGANEKAIKSYMFGLDYIKLVAR